MSPTPKSALGFLSRIVLIISLILLAGLAQTALHAASQIWTNAPVDSAWNNTDNWVGRAVPGALNLTGNTVNNDVATFNSPLAGGIGGAGNPILTDDATTAGARSRQIGGITFDTPDCGAYVISTLSPPVLPDTTTPETGILNVSHNGSIQLTASVTNSQRILVPLFTRLPSSTAGIYNFVNNSTNAATLYIESVTNNSANTRGTDFRLGGSNTGTNTIGSLSAGSTTTGANGLTKQGTGTWILAGPGDFRSQTVIRVQEGTLIVKDPAAFSGATTATVTNTGVLQMDGITLNQTSLPLHNGGTLRMNGSNAVNGVAVGAHTGTRATLATLSASDIFVVGTALTANSVVSGGAADTVLRTAGPGTLVFGTDNTYIGRWSFGAATNQISYYNALGTGANANVEAGAILDLTPLGATYFTPTTAGFGASGTGTAIGSTAAAILADAGATLDLLGKTVNLTFTPASSSGDLTHPALYIARGTLALNGNTFIVNNASGTPLGVGTYRLIQQASGGVSSAGGYAVIVNGSGLATGTAAEIQVSGGNVDLVVSIYTPKNLVWKGGNPDSIWDLATTANFLDGATPSVFRTSDNVTFNAVGSANSQVMLAGTLAPGSVTVDTSANDYTFMGTGQIGGGAKLTKIGTGTLQLQTVNTYAGGTVISNGVVQYGVANALPSTGSGDVAIWDGGKLDLNNFDGTINGLNGDGTVDNTAGFASVLTVGNNDRPGSFSGVLKNTSGTLALTKVGTNVLTLAASNSYAGPTTLNAGILGVANEHALGVGDLSLAGGLLDVRSPRLYVNSLAGSAGAVIANNSTASTNRLIVQGTNTTTFGGVIENGAGGGGMALTLLGGSLTMSGGNTYTGGTIVGSGASFYIANGPAGVTGGVIASNGATLGLSGGSTTPGTPTSITTVDGATVSFTAGALGKIWNTQFYGAPNTTNRILAAMSFGGNKSFSNFLGVVRLEANAQARFINIPTGGTGGGDNTTFEFVGNTEVMTRDPATVSLGHIVGGNPSAGINGASSGAGPNTFILGAKGVDAFFQGYIRGTNNIVKAGSGLLSFNGVGATTNSDFATYTNYLYNSLLAYYGNTTISNGVLALVVPNDLSNSPSITLAAPTAVLDASQMGYVSNFTDAYGDNSALITNGTLRIYSGQTLAGLGTIRGALIAEPGSVVAPGLPVGVLTITNGVALNGTINFDLNRTSTPQADQIAAPSVDVSGATINVTNLGPDLVTGDTFQLFSGPVVGTPLAVNLPAQNQAGTIPYVWTNLLAVNGSIKVLSGASPVDPTPTNLTASVSGNQLTLSWPASHTGWDLQTNAVDVANPAFWFTYPGSSATNQVTVTLDPSQTNVFYRLRLTP
jgi:autotransporter-associated beta strand protein